MPANPVAAFFTRERRKAKPEAEQPDNPKVQAKGLVSLPEAPPDWLFMARRKLVYAHPGGGTVVVVAR